MNTVQEGSIYEHMAGTWLMKRGYDVFKNMSPRGGIDLVAISGTEIRKFDAKKTKLNSRGNFIHKQLRKSQKIAGIELILVLENGDCFIQPQGRNKVVSRIYTAPILDEDEKAFKARAAAMLKARDDRFNDFIKNMNKKQ